MQSLRALGPEPFRPEPLVWGRFNGEKLGEGSREGHDRLGIELGSITGLTTRRLKPVLLDGIMLSRRHSKAYHAAALEFRGAGRISGLTHSSRQTGANASGVAKAQAVRVAVAGKQEFVVGA